MRPTWFLISAALSVITALEFATASARETSPTVEVRNDKTVTTGRMLAQGKERGTLLDRVGRLHDIDLNSAKLKVLNGSFQALPTTELRNQLSREFGKNFEISSTRHYLVVATNGRAANYAAVFEDQYATLQRYFKTRGFSLSDPEFPLVAIVFPDQKQFTNYAQVDNAKSMTGMLGYYSPRTNRVALFESQAKSVAVSTFDQNAHFPFSEQSSEIVPFDEKQHLDWKPSPLDHRSPIYGSNQGDLKSTMIHEATHQIAYNIGLHSRVGETPRWVVEGMATVFESDGVRDSSAGWTAKQRINLDRYLSFQNYAKTRRAAKSLKTFIECDSLYESAVADFYAQSWALSFFLVETRPRQYASYLKRISARDPFAKYPAKDRIVDFKESFQVEFDLLDAQFLRYIDGLK